MFLFSCTENPANLSVDEKSNVYEINAHNQTLEILSIAYAKALQEEEIRSIIKSEALKRFDGDYDVLHKTISEKTINGVQLNAILAKNVNSSGAFKSAIPVNSTFIDSLAAIIKNLQISVPIHCEKWNIDGFIPKVIFLPSNFNEKNFDKLKAYNADGSYEWISTIEEPDVPYIVISPSERVGNENSINTTISAINTVNEKQTDGSFKSVSALPTTPNITKIEYGGPLTHFIYWSETENETGYEVYRSSGFSFAKIATTGINDNKYVDNSGIVAGKRYTYLVRAINNEGPSNFGEYKHIMASDRTINSRMRVTKLYMSKSRLKAVESWVSGAPEIRLYIVNAMKADLESLLGSVEYTSEMMEPGQRGDIQDQWWTIFSEGIKTSEWSVEDCDNHSCLNFVWVEEDWEDKNELTVAIKLDIDILNLHSNLDYKIPSSKGELISCQQVYWWEPKNGIYESGGFKFNLNEIQ